MLRRVGLPTLAGLLAGILLAALPRPSGAGGGDTGGGARISPERLLQHVRVLASDTFEGRSPASHGEDLTVAYLVRQFRAAGLEPGNPDGTYVQNVPLSAFRTQPLLQVRVGGGTLELHSPADYVAFSTVRRQRFAIEDSPLVFVGYGVQAPEYGWDDYKGVDVRGKTLIMLINDPPLPDAERPGELDPALFGGKAMTYYGRWTYKYEIAAKLGAAAAIIVHETGPAAYPYPVVVNSWSGENFSLRYARRNPDFPEVAAWITDVRARELFARSGLDFAALKASALRRDFRPVALAGSAHFDIRNSWRDVESRNVVARIGGSDPSRARETVIYSAHWDHFGWNPQLPGPKSRQVFHGALDNASGTAALLELAAAFRALPQPPARSLLFIATTAEERGLLGAAWYARHPLVPLSDTVAVLNIDGINPYGRTRDIEIVGHGKSELDELAAAAAASQGRRTQADAHPERGGFYRADQLEFARAGVPVLYLRAGREFVGQAAGYGEARTDAFIANDYHQVSDVIGPEWTMQGGAEDVQLLWQVGAELAGSRPFPAWKPGSEFQRPPGGPRPAH